MYSLPQHLGRSVLLGGLLCCVLVGTAGADVGAGLFQEAGATTVADGRGNPVVVRSRVARPELGQLDAAPDTSDVIVLNLFEDVTLTAVRTRTDRPSPGGRCWCGDIAEIAGGHVTLAVRGDVMVGSVVTPEGAYRIRSVGDGRCVIQEIDPCQFPPEKTPVGVSLPPAAGGDAAGGADSGLILDVLVVYTAAARTAAGGTTQIRATIDQAIAESNTSYLNSGINQRLRLVHRQEVSYSETSFNWDTTLDRLKGTTDGYMDNVHSLRNQYCADHVVLLVADDAWCGLAYLMETVSSSFASWAFALVNEDCATGYFSFAHELGHNQAARHDWYVDAVNNKPYTYNHAYVNRPDKWRTVMAYNVECKDNGVYCYRLQYWSNPDVKYGGDAMGVPEGSYHAADNRKTLNNTATTCANFRQSCMVEPVADCRANGVDDWLTVTTKNPVSLTVSLDIGFIAGRMGDYWAVVVAPWGYYSLTPAGWVQGIKAFAQFPLGDVLPSLEIYNGTLPAALYIALFGVDDQANGILDGIIYWDAVWIEVTP